MQGMAQQFRLMMDVPLSQRRLDYLASTVEAPGTPAEKAKAVILALVEAMADGGLMLSADEVQRIRESTGVELTCGADLLPFLSEATGREAGCRVIKILIDPAYETPLDEIATVRGQTVEEILRETLQVALDNNWYESLPEAPRTFRMTEVDAKALEEVLGETFANGTDLAKLIRKTMGTDGGLFDDGPPSVEKELAPQAAA